ncbi:MAG: inorganic diphosphatase [Gammaproteobacteria bacterium]|nr:inorganic diphosphatase [Gammaproteobacteria bacterium]
MRYDALPLAAGDGTYHAVVEAVAGSRHKFKYEPALGVFVLHAVLPAGLAFPVDFGFLPATRGGDGDPLDVLLCMDEPAPCGSVVRCRLLGVIEARQKKAGGPWQRNDRLLAAVEPALRYARCRAPGDLPPGFVDDLERFFAVYNDAREVRFEVLGHKGAAAAARLVKAGRA